MSKKIVVLTVTLMMVGAATAAFADDDAACGAGKRKSCQLGGADQDSQVSCQCLDDVSGGTMRNSEDGDPGVKQDPGDQPNS